MQKHPEHQNSTHYKVHTSILELKSQLLLYGIAVPSGVITSTCSMKGQLNSWLTCHGHIATGCCSSRAHAHPVHKHHRTHRSKRHRRRASHHHGPSRDLRLLNAKGALSASIWVQTARYPCDAHGPANSDTQCTGRKLAQQQGNLHTGVHITGTALCHAHCPHAQLSRSHAGPAL